MLRMLEWMFDKQVRAGATRHDGRVEASIGCQDPLRCVAQIAGFGARIEVVGPPEARAHLARIGRELVTSYAER
jgi:hypothetical protein